MDQDFIMFIKAHDYNFYKDLSISYITVFWLDFFNYTFLMSKDLFNEDSLFSFENLIDILGYNSIATAHSKYLKKLKDHWKDSFTFLHRCFNTVERRKQSKTRLKSVVSLWHSVECVPKPRTFHFFNIKCINLSQGSPQEYLQWADWPEIKPPIKWDISNKKSI